MVVRKWIVLISVCFGDNYLGGSSLSVRGFFRPGQVIKGLRLGFVSVLRNAVNVLDNEVSPARARDERARASCMHVVSRMDTARVFARQSVGWNCLVCGIACWGITCLGNRICAPALGQ